MFKSFIIQKEKRFQIGTVRPQTDNGIIYEGGGNQIQILIFEHRAKLEPIGKPRKIYLYINNEKDKKLHG